MSIAACLLLYSLAVVLFGPLCLRRLTCNGHAPRFGVAAWLTAIASVLITWVAAVVLVVIDVVGRSDQHGAFITSCLARLRGVLTGHTGIGAQIISFVVAAGVTAMAAVIGVRLVRTLQRLRARAHEHAQAVRIVGHRTRKPDVVVLDVAKPAAYCVPGRPPAIVVTAGALSTLDGASWPLCSLTSARTSPDITRRWWLRRAAWRPCFPGCPS